MALNIAWNTARFYLTFNIKSAIINEKLNQTPKPQESLPVKNLIGKTVAVRYTRTERTLGNTIEGIVRTVEGTMVELQPWKDANDSGQNNNSRWINTANFTLSSIDVIK